MHTALLNTIFNLTTEAINCSSQTRMDSQPCTLLKHPSHVPDAANPCCPDRLPALLPTCRAPLVTLAGVLLAMSNHTRLQRAGAGVA